MSGRYRHERFEGALTVGANGSSDERMERPSISSKKNPASYALAGLAARWNVHTKSGAFSGEAVGRQNLVRARRLVRKCGVVRSTPDAIGQCLWSDAPS